MEIIEKKMPVDKEAERVHGQAEKLPKQEPFEPKEAQIPQTDPQAVPDTAVAPVRDEESIMIESILSEDIYSIYNELSEAKKKEFQKKGVEVSAQIKKMLRKTKIKVHDLLELIKNWLLLLPGINNFFLEQEAKIKTDKILELKRSGQNVER